MVRQYLMSTDDDKQISLYQIWDNTNCTQTKERATYQIQKVQHTKREQITKLQNQNQAVTNLSYYSKLQPTNIKEPNQERASFSHTHSLNLPQHSIYIGDLSRLAYPKPRRTRLLFYTQKENHSYST